MKLKILGACQNYLNRSRIRIRNITYEILVFVTLKYILFECLAYEKLLRINPVIRRPHIGYVLVKFVLNSDVYSNIFRIETY